MRIIVRNSAGIAKKHIRLLKWKLYGLNRSFQDLHYAEIFVKREGSRIPTYEAVLRLGVPGHDIILRHKSTSPAEIVVEAYRDAHRYLAKRAMLYRSRMGNGLTASLTTYS